MNVSDPAEITEAAKAKAVSQDDALAKTRSATKEAAVETGIEIEPVGEKDIVASEAHHSGDAEDESLHKVYPTEEELRTLRRVSDKIPWTAFTVAFVELCERFSYYGTTAVCMNSSSLTDYINRLRTCSLCLQL